MIKKFNSFLNESFINVTEVSNIVEDYLTNLCDTCYLDVYIRDGYFFNNVFHEKRFFDENLRGTISLRNIHLLYIDRQRKHRSL